MVLLQLTWYVYDTYNSGEWTSYDSQDDRFIKRWEEAHFQKLKTAARYQYS